MSTHVRQNGLAQAALASINSKLMLVSFQRVCVTHMKIVNKIELLSDRLTALTDRFVNSMPLWKTY